MAVGMIWFPAILKLDCLDEVIGVDDGDAILMAQKLSSRLGLGVGISSGATFLGAVKLQNMLGADNIVVAIFPDDNNKYLSTDLIRKEPLGEDYLSVDIELDRYIAHRRVCQVCCDPSNCAEAEFSSVCHRLSKTRQ